MASSSSRMPLSRRPHGLRISSQTTSRRDHEQTTPKIRTHQPASLNWNGPKRCPAGTGGGAKHVAVAAEPVRGPVTLADGAVEVQPDDLGGGDRHDREVVAAQLQRRSPRMSANTNAAPKPTRIPTTTAGSGMEIAKP